MCPILLAFNVLILDTLMCLILQLSGQNANPNRQHDFPGTDYSPNLVTVALNLALVALWMEVGSRGPTG